MEAQTIQSTQAQALASQMLRHRQLYQLEAWAVELAMLVCVRTAHFTAEALVTASTHMSNQYDGNAKLVLMTNTGTRDAQIRGIPSDLANAEIL